MTQGVRAFLQWAAMMVVVTAITLAVASCIIGAPVALVRAMAGAPTPAKEIE